MTTEQIWHDYHTRLRAFIAGRVGEDSADDLLQDVFIKTHAHRASLRDETKLESWLFRVARNAVTDHYRAARPSDPLPEWLAAPESDPASEAQRELAACLGPMIDRLPEKYRGAVRLAELEGLTQAEVARREGLSLSGAKSRVQRGRERLRGLLLDCCEVQLSRSGGVMGYTPRERCGSGEPCTG
ncbi:MAG: RNA polymerase sigma factor SigZ [Gemmatimonadetes bacterium]|nr:RNA polymerase sigma factor SigZ [Gemmatimonadota bacterium]